MTLRSIRRIGLPLVAAVAALAAVAAPAVATPGTASGTGVFKTFPEAQAAVGRGFQLYKPTTSYSLPNVGHVIVTICEVQGKTNKRVVTVSYGNFNTHSLALTQDDASGPCGDGAEGTYLASYRIHGIKAQLWGYCGILGAPACSSTKIELWLIWQHTSDYYVASSYNESRTRLVNFASSLKKV
jgi:hypothetical protein